MVAKLLHQWWARYFFIVAALLCFRNWQNDLTAFISLLFYYYGSVTVTSLLFSYITKAFLRYIKIIYHSPCSLPGNELGPPDRRALLPY
jgi:hypothetical protein